MPVTQPYQRLGGKPGAQSSRRQKPRPAATDGEVELSSHPDREVFPPEAARAALPFRGERMTSAIAGQVAVEQYHRYLLARDYCGGRDVLDLAAGEGYGTALLSQVARSATGVEI